MGTYSEWPWHHAGPRREMLEMVIKCRKIMCVDGAMKRNRCVRDIRKKKYHPSLAYTRTTGLLTLFPKLSIASLPDFLCRPLSSLTIRAKSVVLGAKVNEWEKRNFPFPYNSVLVVILIVCVLGQHMSHCKSMRVCTVLYCYNSKGNTLIILSKCRRIKGKKTIVPGTRTNFAGPMGLSTTSFCPAKCLGCNFPFESSTLSCLFSFCVALSLASSPF